MASSRTDAGPVERGWDQAARGYDSYFGPRFAPYLGAAVGALSAHAAQRGLPGGALLVPCVGPGRELAPLASAFPERKIIASDLSSEMVALAAARTSALPNVLLEHADALRLVPPAEGAAALFSVFGLQLLPDPVLALRSWMALLNVGGVAAIVYWPRQSEPKGPFFSMRRLLTVAGVADGTWEQELLSGLPAAGASVLADIALAFEIEYEDAPSLWQALTQLGPLRALANARGRELIDALGAQFALDLQGEPTPLRHTPRARLLLIERR